MKLENDQAIELLAGLAHDSRFRMFRELIRAHSPTPDEGGLAAGELARRCVIPAPTLSFHLKEMSRAGLVKSQRKGRSIIYRADIEAMENLVTFLLEDCCGGACDISINAAEGTEVST